jgi:secreted trypsin-like serine protease
MKCSQLDDVSVIRLSKPVTFGRYIQPVCLHQGSPKYDTGSMHADVMGWGQVSAKGRPSDILNTVRVRILTNKECVKAYGNKAPAGITSGMVCAGGNGRDSCKGDSGGPLVLTINSQTQTRQQIGVVSWGIGCATFPGMSISPILN